MCSRIVFCLCIFSVVFTSSFDIFNVSSGLRLKQVVILSRHGLRTPLSNQLSEMTPKKWPQWNKKPGYLTDKGAVLESYMGRYFSAWLIKMGLLPNDCPNADIFYVYANNKQRTLESAKAFARGAYARCNVTIHHAKTEVDAIFNPEIHNSSSVFLKTATRDMEKILERLSLNKTYLYIENVLDYKDSQLCLSYKKCDLTTDANEALVIVGEKPMAKGPIKISNSVIDAFVMQYYQGFAPDKVAWGHLKSSVDWLSLTNLSKSYHQVIFGTSLIARDIARPLIAYLSEIFSHDRVPNVTLLMGHDANINTVLNSLRFKQYFLPKQYELIPISGKIVFQKWYDLYSEKYFLRTVYVYQSTEQLRNASVLSIDRPPQFVTLELSECKADENGLCPWEDFQDILESLIHAQVFQV